MQQRWGRGGLRGWLDNSGFARPRPALSPLSPSRVVGKLHPPPSPPPPSQARQLLSLGLMHHQSGLTLAGLSDLTPGTNKGQALLCRPLVFLAPPLNASATL